MTTLTVKIPEEMRLELANEAKGRGASCSELVRQAVANLLAGRRGRSSGTCLSRALDLAGCLNGEHDLATNPDHMKGFGA